MTWTTRAAALTLVVPLLGGAGAKDKPTLSKQDADHPSFGVLLDTKENTVEHYWCALEDDEKTLACDFVESSFERQLAPADVEAFVRKEIADFGKEDRSIYKEDKESCAQIPAKIREVQQSTRLTDEEKQDGIGLLEAYFGLCRDPSDANIERFVRWEAAQKSKTCNATIARWSMKFTRAISPTKAWVAAEQNSRGLLGTLCGARDFDRFEVDAKRDNPFLTQWTYHIRRVITNPNGIFFGAQCSKFEEPDRELDDQKATLNLGCSTLDFSFGR